MYTQGRNEQHHLSAAFPPPLWQLNIPFIPPCQASSSGPYINSLGNPHCPYPYPNPMHVGTENSYHLLTPSLPPPPAGPYMHRCLATVMNQLFQPPPSGMTNTPALPLQPFGGMPIIGPYRNLHVGTSNFHHFPNPSPPPPPPTGPSKQEFNYITCKTSSLKRKEGKAEERTEETSSKRKEKMKEKRKQKRMRKKRRIEETKAKKRTETNSKIMEKIREKRKLKNKKRKIKKALFSSTELHELPGLGPPEQIRLQSLRRSPQ